MFGVRQVGFLVGVGPIFVATIGTESKVAILQCSVEPRGWVTRIMAPEHVRALNAAGGGSFPYSEEQCSIEGYNNLDYVTLGTNDYQLPNFGSSYALNGYVNLYSDWKKTTFTAPNVIRTKAEWDYYGGNPGTPVTTTPTTGNTGSTSGGNTSGGNTSGGSTSNGGTSNGGTTTVVTNPTSKAPTTSNTLIYVGIAVLIFIVVIAMANND